MQGWTCCASGGFGAQYQACMSGLAYARYKNESYLHSNFEKMDHGVDAKEMDEFTGLRSDKWWKYSKEITIKQDNFIDDVHWAKRPSLYYTTDVINEIRRMYYSTQKPNVKEYDIALHIRRGDVHKEMKEESFRYVPNNIYSKILKNICRGCNSLKIAIVSQGVKEDFQSDFSMFKNIEYILDEDLKISFHTLVKSNLFVMSRSSFSYCAGIISEGTKIYHQFWHNPLDNWMHIKKI